MPVTTKNVLFCTSIPKAKSGIAPGTIEASADTAQCADIAMFVGFYVLIFWPDSVPKGPSVRIHILDSNFLRWVDLTILEALAKRSSSPVTTVVNQDIKFHIVLKFHQRYVNNMRR